MASSWNLSLKLYYTYNNIGQVRLSEGYWVAFTSLATLTKAWTGYNKRTTEPSKKEDLITFALSDNYHNWILIHMPATQYSCF